MDRRTFIGGCLAAGTLATVGSVDIRSTERRAHQSLGNIVLVIADDHGQDAGCYGNPVIQTPNLDALAADGTRFHDAFATTASCSASRSVILTGLHNHRTGQYGHMHDYSHFRSYEHLQTVPVLLKQAGYRTGAVGKFHVAPEETYRFDEYGTVDQRSPAEMAEQARHFITAGDGTPFFLMVAPSDPHRSGDRAAWLAQPANAFGNRPPGQEREGSVRVSYTPEEVIVPAWLPDNEVTRAELTQYYQSVSRLDQSVGALVDVLKDTGVYDATLIIYVSDHGVPFPGAKTTTYEPGLRSPLIVRHPNVEKRGMVNMAMVSWVDVAPTILDFAGVEPPTYEQHIHNRQADIFRQLPEQHGLHGRSFLTILEEEHPEGWDEVMASHTFHEIQMYYPMRVVRGRTYKLIWNIVHPLPYPFASDLWVAPTWQHVYRQGMEASYGMRTVKEYIHRPAFELYDLDDDPHEAHNLAEDPRHADVLEEYQTKLKAFQVQTSDPWLLKWQYA